MKIKLSGFMLIFSLLFCCSALRGNNDFSKVTVTTTGYGQLITALTNAVGGDEANLSKIKEVDIKGYLDYDDIYSLAFSNEFKDSLRTVDMSGAQYNTTTWPSFGGNQAYITWERVSLPGNISYISYNAFQNNKSLEKIVFPNGLKIIYDYAFSGCQNLSDLNLPEGLEYIYYNAFYECTSLITIKVPNSVTYLGSSCFSGCSKLQSAEIDCNISVIEDYTFYNCTSLKEIRLGDNIKKIMGGAFQSCESLEYIKLPESLETIEAYAFEYCINLKKIDFNEKLLSIGYNAFQSCRNLESLEFPGLLLNIGNYAFYECYKLKEAIIPNSVQSIGNNAFFNCRELEKVSLSNSLRLIDSYTFSNCSKLMEISIPFSVKNIEDYAFAYCDTLKNISFPEELKSIGNSAFYQCHSLEQISLPNQVRNIGNNAFYDCSKIGKEILMLPDSLLTIGEDAFSGCNYSEVRAPWETPVALSNDIFGSSKPNIYVKEELFDTYLTTNWDVFGMVCSETGNSATINIAKGETLENTLSAYIDNIKKINNLTITGDLDNVDMNYIRNSLTRIINLDISEIDMTELPYRQFYQTNLIDIKLPDNLSKIGEQAFYESKIKTISLPASLKEIGAGCFTSCKNLASIALPEGLETIEASMFTGATSLKEVNLPQSLQTIGRYAFQNCKSLENIDIPANVSTIEEYVFSECSSLKEIVLPDLIKVIPNYAFYKCTSLQSVVFPNYLEEIGSYSFQDSNIKEIKFPKPVKKIGEYAFSYCPSLKEVVFSDSLTSLGDNAFRNCTSLEKVIFNDNLTSINSYVFQYCSRLKDVKLPAKLSYISWNAFSNCALETIELPASLTTISNYAFYCSSLKEITCLGSTPPSLDSDAFGSLDKSQVQLFVPGWSLNEYKQDNQWKYFVLTKPIENYITDYIAVNKSLTFSENAVPAGNPDIEITTSGRLLMKDNTLMTPKKMSFNITSLSFSTDYNLNRRYMSGNFGTIKNEGEIEADTVSFNIGFSSNNYWYFITFPTDVRLSEITNNSNSSYVFRTYDSEGRANNGTGSNWKNLPANAVLEAGKGYIFKCNNTTSLTFDATQESRSKMFSNTDVVTTLNEYKAVSPVDESWNFTGNPYPCYFDIAGLEFDAPITVWNGSTYEAISLVDDKYILSPYQAFFVQKPEGTESVRFNAEGRNTEREYVSGVRRMAKGESVSERKLVNLEISGEKHTDRCRVVINPEATTDYEFRCDAAKFMSSEPDVPQIFTRDAKGNMYAINERPLEDRYIDLCAYIGEKGTYRIAAPELRSDVRVELLDSKNNLLADLSETEYSFEAEAGMNNYVLRVVTATTGIASSEIDDTNVSVISGKGRISVRAEEGKLITVYSQTGAVVASEVAISENNFSLSAGTYIVKVEGKTLRAVVY